MEILGFGVICAIFSFLGKQIAKLTTENIVETIIGSAGGEAVEECLEAFIKKLFPKSIFYLRHHNKNMKTMLAEIVEYIKELDAKQFEELKNFFEKNPMSGKWKNYDLEKELFDAKNGERCISHKAKKELDTLKLGLQKFEEELQETQGKTKKIQIDSIHYINADEAVKKIFGVEKCPAAMVFIVEIINRHVYEQLFIGLSSDDREMVKVVQWMIHENNQEFSKTISREVRTTIESSIRDILDIIIQHHDSGMLASYTLREKAEKDPFCYVKLECPDCGATGEYLWRVNDRAYCKKCGAVYDIISRVNDDEIQNAITHTKKEILKKLELIEEDLSEEMRKGRDRLATKIVSAEFFETKLRAQDERAEKRFEALDVRIKAESEKLAKALEKREKNSDEYKDAFHSAIGAATRRLDNFVAVMGDQLLHISDQTDEILSIVKILSSDSRKNDNFRKELSRWVSVMNVKMDDILGCMQGISHSIEEVKSGEKNVSKRLNKQFDEWQEMYKELLQRCLGLEEVRAAARLHNRGCPRCEREVAFLFKEKVGAYLCPSCNFAIKPSDIIAPGLVSDGEILATINSVGDNIFLDKLESVDVGKKLLMKIWLTTGGRWERSIVKHPDLERCNPEVLILVSEHHYCLSKVVFKKIASLYENVKKIIIGRNLVLSEEAKALEGWKFNEKSNVFGRKSK